MSLRSGGGGRSWSGTQYTSFLIMVNCRVYCICWFVEDFECDEEYDGKKGCGDVVDGDKDCL